MYENFTPEDEMRLSQLLAGFQDDSFSGQSGGTLFDMTAPEKPSPVYGDMTPDKIKLLNELLSQTTMRSSDFNVDTSKPQAQGQPSLSAQEAASGMFGNMPVAPQQPAAAPKAPKNFVKSSSGEMIDLDYASQRRPDVWADGAQVVGRTLLPSGETEVRKRVPTFTPDGRQTSAIVREVITPDYLNPAKLKELAYRTKLAELQGGGKDESRKFLEQYRLYEMMPEGPMKTAFGRKTGITDEGKPMSEMAKIESDFKAGRINEDQRGMAIAATPGGKNQQKLTDAQMKSRETLEKSLAKIDTDLAAIDKLIDPSGKSSEDLRSYAGPIDIQLPVLFQGASRGKSALEPLRARETMQNLADAKKTAGQSFGAMSVKEWPRFENMDQFLDPGLNDVTLGQNLNKFRADLLKSREILTSNLSKFDEGGAAPTAAAAPAAPAAAQGAPQIGAVSKGFVFLGGNPSNPQSWKKVQ